MKQRTCKWCKQKYSPIRQKQVCCSLGCEENYGIKLAYRSEQIRGLEARKTLRLQKEKLKTRSQLLREAQTWFNKYIRLRDQLAGHPCISSGRPLDWSGNNVDAGHYRSTGSAPHLRFDERNCHAQSKHDNRYLSGNAVEYRINLIKRIGIGEVLDLESDNTPRKYTISDLKNIIQCYKLKIKELKCKTENSPLTQ